MVFCSSSLALAAIELFVHLEPSQLPSDLVSVTATLPDGEPARTLASEKLPRDWWADTQATREVGDEWIRAVSSLALKVPSVPIRSEWNILINPRHSRAAELRIDAPQPFVFHARMFERGSR